MDKKIVKILVTIIVICAIIAVVVFAVNRSSENSNNENTSNEVNSEENNVERNNETVANNTNEVLNEADSEDDNQTSATSNTLVVYYSAQNHTEAVAERIAENLNADIFELVPVDEYTEEDLDYTDDNSRVSREYEDELLRDVELESTEVDNWEDYDTVLIGYPIWWGIAAWPVNSFVENNDFTGKTVIPFCTSSSSGLGQSGEILAELAGTGDWQEGHRFRSNPSDSDIDSWTDSIQ